MYCDPSVSIFFSSSLDAARPHWSARPLFIGVEKADIKKNSPFEMGRGKGVLRKDSSHDVGMVGRRSYMEHLHPLAPHPQKRLPDRALPRSSKRPRPDPSVSSDSTPPPAPSFLYAPNRHIDVDKLLSNAPSRQATVHIYADYLTSANQAIKNRLLWGTDEYTEDSDIVAILLHTGHYVPPATKSTSFDFLSVRIKVDRHVRRESPPFEASDRNGLRSRSWSCLYDGGRLSMLGVSIFKNDKSVDLHPRVEPQRVPLPGIVTSSAQTKGGANNAGFIESVVSFDMVNRPCLKYDLKEVASLSSQENRNPLARLKEEALYVENEQDRFEICALGEDAEQVRLGRVKRRAIVREIMAASASSNDVAVPLDAIDIDVLEELPLKELYWDLRGVSVRGKHYPLSKMSFRRKWESTS